MEIPHENVLTLAFYRCFSGCGFTWHNHEGMGNGGDAWLDVGLSSPAAATPILIASGSC
jgi:hypothetical protein